MIYPSQVTRVKRFLEDFLREFREHENADRKEATYRYGALANRAADLHEMLKLELVLVGSGAEERRSER